MVDRSPKVTVNTHHPTGAAEVSISVWLDEDEREGLMNRVFSQQTLLHDRERVIEALQVVDDDGQRAHKKTDAGGARKKHEWEVTLK